MSKSTVSVQFSVAADTESSEFVGVVGNIPELGSWLPARFVPLESTGKTENGKTIWSVRVSIAPGQTVHYRFLKAFIKPQENSQSGGTNGSSEQQPESISMVSSWECHLNPRSLEISDDMETPPIALFGHNRGEEKVDRGWLTTQTEVHLRLHSNPIKMWKGRYRHQLFRIKCSPIDLSHGQEEDHDGGEDEDQQALTNQTVPLSLDEESNHDIPLIENGPPITVSVLRDDLMFPHKQPTFGTMYKEDDYMLLRAQTFDPNTQGYQFDIFVCHPTMNNADMPKHIGSAYLLPMNLDQLNGKKTIPIVGLQQKPIGHIEVDYLIIKPLSGEASDMRVSYARHWSVKSRPLDVGHRGLGATYCHGKKPKSSTSKKYETIKENTIASLSEAYAHGADYVEFDVQLSKDKVPVIYHDLVVGLILKKVGNLGNERFEVPIKDLRAEQLHKLKVNHYGETTTHSNSDESLESTSDTEDSVDDRPFPTLQECLERVHPGIGFNVEIKYCMPLMDGTMEQGLDGFEERNSYVDVILKDLFKYAKDRRIIFSCFDPDVCTMLRLKQNRYPVLFLCSKPNRAWPLYKDIRAHKVTQSAAFCASEQLLGVNLSTDNVLMEPELVDKIKNLGLISFCWGWNEETNSKDTVARVKQLGVNAVIYDKIYAMDLKRDKDFVIDQEVLVTNIVESTHSLDRVDMALEKSSRSEATAVSSHQANLGFSGKIQGTEINEGEQSAKSE